MDSGIARVARVVCWIAGVATVASAVRSPWFRDPDGALTRTVCLALAGGLSLIVAGSGLGTRYQQFLCWGAVALAGQAVTLQMIDAGPRLHYQHYEPIGRLWGTRPWLLAAVGAHSLLVGGAVVMRARAIAESMRGAIRSWQLVAVAILSFSTAATVSPSVSRYLSELVFAASLQLLGVVTIVLAAMAFPGSRLERAGRVVDRFLQGSGNEPADDRLRLDRLAWCSALLVTLTAAVLSVFSYQRLPHVKDEVGYLLHARYLANGMLTMPAPPVPTAFYLELMEMLPDRWFCPVPPGWPAVLAVGVAARAPWLVNPILGGVNVLLAYMILRHLYDRRTARTGVMLLSISPWHLFLAMSFMTHTLTLTLALLAAVGVIQARRTAKARWGLVAGCAIGGVALVRPLDALIVGGVLALWSLGFGGRRLTWASLAAVGIGTAVAGGLTPLYNARLTGDPWKFPINAYIDKHFAPNANAFGFGRDRGMGWDFDPYPGHGPLDATINANLNTFSINTDLFGWSTGSLIFIALLMCTGSVSRVDRLMLAVLAVVFGLHFFYYFSGGPDFGARYWYLMVVPIVALTARGIDALGRSPAGARVSIAVLALSVGAVVNFVPWRAVDKYYHYRGMRSDVRELAKQYAFDGALVLIRGPWFPDYASAAVDNPIGLKGPGTIYAWDRDGEVRIGTLRAFPNRPVWLLDGPTLTRSGHRIVTGPLPAAAVLAQTSSSP